MPERPTTTPRDRGETLIEKADREHPLEMALARLEAQASSALERAISWRQERKALLDGLEQAQAEIGQLREVVEAVRHRGQCHGSVCDCDMRIRLALEMLDVGDRHVKEEWHYTDCGIAGGFPHKASDHTEEGQS